MFTLEPLASYDHGRFPSPAPAILYLRAEQNCKSSRPDRLHFSCERSDRHIMASIGSGAKGTPFGM